VACFGDGLSRTAQAEQVDFERDVRPLFKRHCIRCHGPSKQVGGLRLDAKSFFFRGGDSGQIVVANNSQASELLRRIVSEDAGERMPPEESKLSETDSQIIRQWIDEGAIWQETEEDRLASQDQRLEHWAWKKIKPIDVPNPLPEHDSEAPIRNDIDRFILAKLRDHNLSMSSAADKRTLIRRLSFDLLGLPPSPKQIEAFLADNRDDAYERLVDQYLESPHYGERAAQHWLDIAHYADTHGFERDQVREHAWRYRDWVIQAFNDDMPYPQFLQKQIAGDAIEPNNPSSVIATGFLAAGPFDFVGQKETPSPVLKRLARADDLDDMVTQVLSASCAVTINCARCHDHKLDPISQSEYYALCAVFAGAKRENRPISPAAESTRTDTMATLRSQIQSAKLQLRQLTDPGWSLADIVGGGNGLGTGKPKWGIDPNSGNALEESRGFLEGLSANLFHESNVPIIDGVVVPDGGELGDVTISSTGLQAVNVPRTSGKAWDAIRNGPVFSQFSTKLGQVDYGQPEHTLLGIHANAAITFDLSELPALDASQGIPQRPSSLKSQLAYFGETKTDGATLTIWLDGKVAYRRERFGRDDGLSDINITIPQTCRFLTIMATDNGNGISHDQICLVDPVLVAQKPTPSINEASSLNTNRISELQIQIDQWARSLDTIATPELVFGVVSEPPPPMHIHARGNPEQLRDLVVPGALRFLDDTPLLSLTEPCTDLERRQTLANWLTAHDHPLTDRVIVNRLWQQHFGTGIVATPSDFGLGGSLPTHPELLDWLALQLRECNGSLKKIHKLICCSATYRQNSMLDANNPLHQRATEIDSSNRFLWRQTPRRLDGESIRDAILATSNRLNTQMFGPGFRDFDYQEEYAPVYNYVVRDDQQLNRRSIYRFRVRTTPHPLLMTLDCPNLSNFTPTRNITTTALQSLALLNNDFVLLQSEHFAQRLGEMDSIEEQIRTAWVSAFGRPPTEREIGAAKPIIETHGLPAFCRFLLNSNEFVYID
jgi:hypothetical protein